MFVLVLAAEADETRQAITFLIVCLVGIAVLLALLTVWYWQFTSPKRRAATLLTDLGHYEPGPDGQLPPIGPVESAVSALGAGPVPATDLAFGPVLEGSSDAESKPERPPLVVPASAQRIEVPDRAGGRPLAAEARIEVAGRSGRPDPVATASSPDGGLPPRVADGDRSPASRSAEPAGSEPASSAVTGSAVTGSAAADTGVAGTGAASVAAAIAESTERAAARTSGGGLSSRPETVRPPSGTGGRLGGAAVPAGAARSGDELTEARRRRDQRNEVLSDEDWAAVMKSAFDKMHQ